MVSQSISSSVFLFSIFFKFYDLKSTQSFTQQKLCGIFRVLPWNGDTKQSDFFLGKGRDSPN